MNDLDPLLLKELIAQALEACTDLELLDFIYKLIINL